MFVGKGEDAERKRIERGIEMLRWQRKNSDQTDLDRNETDHHIREAKRRLRGL